MILPLLEERAGVRSSFSTPRSAKFLQFSLSLEGRGRGGRSVGFLRNAMKEATRKGIGPQITQINADEEFWNGRARRERRKKLWCAAFSCSSQFAVSAFLRALASLPRVQTR
jgi:hypothetical protein